MPDPSAPSQTLLTLDDVRRLREERDALAREYEVLGRRLEGLNAKLEAAALFLPAHLLGRMTDSQPGNSSRRKWGPVVFRLLEDAGHGLTTGDIRGKIAGTTIAEDVGYQGGALYNGLAKLVSRKELVKIGHYYCLPGQSPPDGVPKAAEKSQLQADIEVVLSRHPQGLKSGEILHHIMRDKMLSAQGMTKSTGYFYKIVSIMVAAGSVRKEGQRYFPVIEGNEPSGVSPPNGSDAGSDEAERPRTLRLV